MTVAGAVLLAAAVLLLAEPMLASPSLVSAIWLQGWQQGLVAIWQQLVVGAAMLYPACVSGGLLLELLTPQLHRLEAPLRAVHKTRDCVACLFLFAPLFALGSRHTHTPRTRTTPVCGVPPAISPSAATPPPVVQGEPRRPVPGVLWLPAGAHKIAIFQQSFIDPPKHYIGWYVLFSGVVVALLLNAIF